MAVTWRDLDENGKAGKEQRHEALLQKEAAPQRPTYSAGSPIPRVYGAALLMFGLPSWPLAAWFTASGWVWVLNYVLNFLRLPWVIPQPSGVPGVIAAIIVGGIYSRIELRPPMSAREWRTAAALWLVWATIIVSDIGTTYQGIVLPGVIAAALAVLLTFGPDQATMRGWRILRGYNPF